MTPITDKIKTISPYIILEGMIIIIIINLLFSLLYYNIYLTDNKSFKYVNTYNNENEKIEYFDFAYYTFTSFFRLGYDIIPTNKLTKVLVVIQLNTSFIISAAVIGEIL